MFDRRVALAEMVGALQQLPPAADAVEMVECLRLAEEVKAVAAAVQAVDAVALSDLRRAESAERDAAALAGPGRTAVVAGPGRTAAVAGPGRAVRREEQGRVDAAVAREVGLAVRTSPFRARRIVGWARVLTAEMPATFAELSAGRTTEHRAFLAVKETVFLSRQHRVAVDAAVAPRLEQLGDRRTEAVVREHAYRLDPAAFVARARAATADRHVSVRPAPDCMVRLSALLPVAAGVACYAALKAHADTAVGTGAADGRGRGQVMADALVDRLTGRHAAEAGTPAGSDVQLNVVMTDRALFTGGDEPAHLIGYGPLPAGMARDLAATAARAWLRRLYTDPVTGQVNGMDTRARFFTDSHRHYLIVRDQLCRTPYCGEPIWHADHIESHIDGGPTTISNGDGLCAACNYTKDHPGWTHRATPDGTITITAPTGHRYTSRPPDPPGSLHNPPRDRAG